MKSFRGNQRVFLLLLILSFTAEVFSEGLGASIFENLSPDSALRVPTGQFDPGSEFYQQQVLTGNLASYVPESVYTATIERSLISSGNTARLRRVMRKAQNGEPIVVGCIGGSITQGAGTSVAKNRYADHIYQWWKTNFPDSPITYVNAGIGGTPSSYGVFRSGPHLFSKKPDLVLIEFAVNDIGLDAQTVPYMEGLIRKAFDEENDPAVMLLFMMSSTAAESAGSFPSPWQAMNGEVFEYEGTVYGLNVQNYQIPLGQHYDLPMISFRDAIFPLLTEGYFKWHEIIFDKVHPNDFGHAFAADLVTHYLDSVREENVNGDPIPPIPPVPQPFNTDKYEKTVYVEFKSNSDTDYRINLSSTEGFERSPRGYWWSAGEKKPATMEITFTGKDFYLGAMSNQDYGSLTLTLKDSIDKTIDQKTFSYKSQYTWYLGGVKPAFTDLELGTYRVIIQTDDLVEILGAGVDDSYSIDFVTVSLKVISKSSGLPLSRVAIDYKDFVTLTNISGEAKLDNLIKGELVISFNHNDYFPYVDSFFIMSDTTIEIELTPKFATAEIFVSDSAGPVGDASIAIGPYQLSTNTQGSALFYNKPAREEYVLHIEKEGYHPILDTLWFEMDTILYYTLNMLTSMITFHPGAIKVFPNPADDFICVSSNRQLRSASIKYVLGQELIYGEPTFQNELLCLDISRLNGGIYLLIAEAAEGEIYKKFFIKN